jgi:glutamine amidotransferase PdxT
VLPSRICTSNDIRAGTDESWPFALLNHVYPNICPVQHPKSVRQHDRFLIAGGGHTTMTAVADNAMTAPETHAGYNAVVERFRHEEYPMLHGATQLVF